MTIFVCTARTRQSVICSHASPFAVSILFTMLRQRYDTLKGRFSFFLRDKLTKGLSPSTRDVNKCLTAQHAHPRWPPHRPRGMGSTWCSESPGQELQLWLSPPMREHYISCLPPVLWRISTSPPQCPRRRAARGSLGGPGRFLYMAGAAQCSPLRAATSSHGEPARLPHMASAAHMFPPKSPTLKHS